MIAEVTFTIIGAIAFFMAGYRYRSIRADKAIAKLAELHRRNVSQARERGIREGIASQMIVETQNARRFVQ